MATYSKVSINGSFRPFFYQERDNDASLTDTNLGYQKEILRVTKKLKVGGKRYIKEATSTLHSQKYRTIAHDLWDAAYPKWDASDDGNMLCWNDHMSIGSTAQQIFEELSGSVTQTAKVIYIENTGSTYTLLISSKLTSAVNNWGIIVPPGATFIAPCNSTDVENFYCKCASGESTTIKAIQIY